MRLGACGEELVARGPKVGGHRQGLDITQLGLKFSALLAEAYMLALAHGALFDVAAVEHFAGRKDLREYAAAVASTKVESRLLSGPLWFCWATSWLTSLYESGRLDDA